MNEDALIARLERRLGRPDPRVLVGIGDDAAVLAPQQHPSVVSVDAQVESVHFRRDWISLKQISLRGVTAALSDIAAMGADATAVLISWTLPAGMRESETDELVEGLAVAEARYGVAIAGGNISSGNTLAQHTTVLGTAKDRFVLRAGAQVGDLVYVSGPLGAAALGLACLQAGERSGPFVERWRDPTARLDLSDQIARHASACIDISDGLVSEITHIATASGVGARIELGRVPVLEGHRARAEKLRMDPDELIAAGGEDYELLFTSREAVPTSFATAIGNITATDEVVTVGHDGRMRRPNRGGYRHGAGNDARQKDDP